MLTATAMGYYDKQLNVPWCWPCSFH